MEKYQLHHKFISFLPKLFLEITAVALVLGIVVYYYNLSGIVASLPILSLYVVVILKIIPSFNLINSSLADLKYSSVSVGLLKNEYDLIKNNTSHINKTISIRSETDSLVSRKLWEQGGEFWMWLLQLSWNDLTI